MQRETFASCIARAIEHENAAAALEETCKRAGDTSLNLTIMRGYANATMWRQRAARYL